MTEPMNDGKTNDPRPVNVSLRYKTKDILAFPAAYFKHFDEIDQLDRTGIVKSRTRERARGANRGAYLYTIAFDDPSTVIDRVRAHGDEGADAMASVIQLVEEGSEYSISDIKPLQVATVWDFGCLESKKPWFCRI